MRRGAWEGVGKAREKASTGKAREKGEGVSGKAHEKA